MPGITQRMLTKQLRALEDDQLVIRKVYAEVPPRVEYTPVGDRREPAAGDRYAEGVGREPSGPAILCARAGQPSNRPIAPRRLSTAFVLLSLPPRIYIWGAKFRDFRMMLIRSFALLLVSAVVATPALAQDRRVPSSAAELRLSYAPIVQRVQPAVVNVYAAKTVQNRNPLLDDPIFRRFFGVPGQQPEQMQRSLGSGVMVDASGLVVTNNHVIEGADQVKISLADKREFEAEIVLKDSRTDLAVLRIKDGKEKFATLDFANSDELLVGDVVLAIGNPFGVGQTVTHGIISALARTQVGITDYQFFIQTDAAINPGNSGGALVDMTGKLAGINTAIFSRSGGSQGIGFAIPANMVRVVVASAKSGGKAVKRPWLGAQLQAVTPEIAETLGLRLPTGALVANVAPNSPAARAGLKLSDLIVAIDGQTDRRSQRVRLSLRHPSARRHRADRRAARRQDRQADGAAGDRARYQPRRDRDHRALAVPGRQGRQHLAGGRRRVAARRHDRRRRGDRSRRWRAPPPASASRRATSSSRSTTRRSPRPAISTRPRKTSSRLWRIIVVRGGQQINVTLGG